MNRRKAKLVAVLLLLALLIPLVVALSQPLAGATRTTGSDPLVEVLNAASTHARCGLTRDRLAAIMLAPTFPETGAPSNRAPSPMTMSRYDNQSALYSFGNTSNYVNAFWHPGVGQWQFDEAGGWGMTAASRIDTRSSALKAADVMATRWCTNPSLSYVWAPWHGCGTTTCTAIYNDIFDGTKLRNLNTESVSRLGGVLPRTCALANRDGHFPCWYVDPARAQGYAGFANPAFGPSPVTAPYYSFEFDGEEVRHWASVDTGYSIPITAWLPQGRNSRTSLRWDSGSALCDLTASRGICDPLPLPGAFLRLYTVNGAYQPFVGDFDGDGRDDTFWYAPGPAADSIWFGRAGDNFTPMPMSVSGTYQPFVGDFDGDGRDDIFWYAPGPAPDFFWYGGANRTFTSVQRNVSGTYQPLVGDFDGDGRDDIFWYAPGPAPDYFWFAGPNRTFASVQRNVSASYQPLVGDFDGDGITDIFWYAPGAAPDYIWYSNGDRTTTTVVEQIYGNYVAHVGDFDGRGHDELFFYGPGTEPDWIFDGNRNAAFSRIRLTVNGEYLTFIADLDGDGVDDVMLYRPGKGADYVLHGSGSRNFFTTQVRVDGIYLPIVGQFNGTGGDDVFWYRPGTPYDAVWFGPAGAKP